MKKIIGVLTFSLIFFTSVELFTRASHLDLQVLRHLLYYNPVDTSLHRASENPELLYELKPNATLIQPGWSNPKEKPGYSKKISTNELGYRFSPWPAEKKKNVFRIVVLGGSYMYGPGVTDTDTFTYQMYKFLKSQVKRPVEVWNAGLTAGVMSQKVELAKKALADINPDLVIFKHFHNFGRRGFYSNSFATMPTSYFIENRFFEKNPKLYCENIPFLFNDNARVDEIHCELLQLSAAYRLLHIVVNNYYVKLEFPNHEGLPCITESFCRRVKEKYMQYANQQSELAISNFLAQHPNLKTVFYDPARNFYCGSDDKTYLDRPVFSFCPKQSGAEYAEIHPPSYVYKAAAKELSLFLIRKGIISSEKNP